MRYGQEVPEPPAPGAPQTAPSGAVSVFKPIIDKVGVPLLWFGLGYLAATMIQRPRRVSS